MRKKIAIIGASYLQMPLVKKAKELNFETHCFAWDDDAVCKEIADFFYPISIIEKEQILEKCRLIEIEGITSIASDAAVNTVNYIADALDLIGNDYEDSENFTNKFIMREKFAENAIASPKYTRVSDQVPFKGLFDLDYPVIVKPVDRSGSRGVQKITSYDNLGNAVETAIKESFAREAIIEEFIEGRELSIECISWEGQHYLLAITDKTTTGAPYFVELEHHQPALLTHSEALDIEKFTFDCLNALGVKYGASHTEIKMTEKGALYVIEVGARMGGDFIGSDLVYLSTGYDFLKGVIEIATGTFTIPQLNNRHYSGVYFLSGETKHIEPIIKEKPTSEIIKVEMLNNNIVPVRCSADRSGYFIYQAEEKMVLN